MSCAKTATDFWHSSAYLLRISRLSHSFMITSTTVIKSSTSYHYSNPTSVILQSYFNPPSAPLQPHFNSTSVLLQSYVRPTAALLLSHVSPTGTLSPASTILQCYFSIATTLNYTVPTSFLLQCCFSPTSALLQRYLSSTSALIQPHFSPTAGLLPPYFSPSSDLLQPYFNHTSSCWCFCSMRWHPFH